MWVFFGEVCYNGGPFLTLIRETRGQEAKEIVRGKGNPRPYSGATMREQAK